MVEEEIQHSTRRVCVGCGVAVLEAANNNKQEGVGQSDGRGEREGSSGRIHRKR
jgi:hypothetical protein